MADLNVVVTDGAIEVSIGEGAAILAAIVVVQAEIAAETTARIAGDAAQKSYIDTQVADLAGSSTDNAAALQSAITGETTARQQGDAAIIGDAPDGFNTLAKVAAALNGDPDFGANVTERFDAQQTAQQQGDAAVIATLSGPGALASLLTFAQVAAALNGDPNFGANLTERLNAQQTAQQEGDAAVIATLSGPGALASLLTFAQVAAALNGDPNFGADIIQRVHTAELAAAEEVTDREAADSALQAQITPDDPETFDAGGPAISVPTGSIPVPGGRTLAWATTSVTSPAPQTQAVGSVAIAAGAGSVTWLAHETIVSVTSMSRSSDNAPMTLGTDYSIDQSRGFVTNITGAAMTLSYVGSLQRKDIISIDPQAIPPVPTITLGTERPRTSEMWAAAVPTGQIEIGRVSRRAAHAYYIPRYKWRNGVHLDRLAQDSAALDYNRQILAPIISRLSRGLSVRVIGYGNSRVAMGMFGPAAKINVNPNSQYSSDPTADWSRDALGFFERWDAATLTRAGLTGEAFNTTPGYNLTGGTPDGFGPVHMREGYVWCLINALHAKYPDAPIEYRNWGISGTATGTGTISGGYGNALFADRWNAVRADIIAGQTLFIPPDPQNELGSSQSYANWLTIAAGAQAAGAVVHFMGLSRFDPRADSGDVLKAAFSAQEMARAAWDSGSAFSDAWNLLSPLGLQGSGLYEDEIASANGSDHEGTILMQTVGGDAARSYT